MEGLDLSESDTDALFASPSHPPAKSHAKPTQPDSQQPSGQQAPRTDDGEAHGEEARETALRKELAGIQVINQTIEGTIESLERARSNLDTVSHTVHDASTLLNTWTRILSHTEHNQRLLLDPSWHGATQDIADMENESLLKQQEKEKRELEEAQRRGARAKKAEEEERKRAENFGTRPPRGPRGRGRGTPRGSVSQQTSTQSTLGSSTRDTGSKVARAGSAIGRGPNSYKGRLRGT
ncbi:MAG: hypothetical protein Q9201_000869 [Fulgogasparrea decipioides]